MAAAVVVKEAALKAAAHRDPTAMWAATVWVTVLHARANEHSLETVHHAMATANLVRDRANAHLVNSTTEAHATMHRVLPVTLMHHAPHVVTMTISSHAPTPTWARKAA
jgi:hypothetical protein